MVNLDNFQLTVENVQSKLSENVSPELINNAINLLLNKGLLLKDQDSNIVRPYQSYTNYTDVKLEQFDKYFKLVSDLAVKSYKLDPSKREIQCFSLAISEDKLPQAKEILRKARNQIAKLAEEGNKNAVYQTNLTMFPLTTPTE